MCLLERDVESGVALGFYRFACIGAIDIGHERPHRRAVVDDVVKVREQVQFLGRADDPNAEERAFVQVERLYERGFQGFEFDFRHFFDRLAVRRVARHHERHPFGIFLDVKLYERMGLYRSFDGACQLIGVEGGVEFQQHRIVVYGLAGTCHAFNVNAELRLRERRRLRGFPVGSSAWSQVFDCGRDFAGRPPG